MSSLEHRVAELVPFQHDDLEKPEYKLAHKIALERSVCDALQPHNYQVRTFALHKQHLVIATDILDASFQATMRNSLERMVPDSKEWTIEWRGPPVEVDTHSPDELESMSMGDLERLICQHIDLEPQKAWLDEMFWRLSQSDEQRFQQMFDVQFPFGECMVRLKPQDPSAASPLAFKLWSARRMQYYVGKLGITDRCGGAIHTSEAARHANLFLLHKHVQQAKANNITPMWNERTSWYAALNGNVPVLKFLIQHGCALSHDCVWAAYHEGHLEALQLLRQHGAPWSREEQNCFHSGSTEAHQRCIIWAAQNGGPWHPSTSYWAASHGFLDVLRMVHDSLQPGFTGRRLHWHEQTLTYATQNGHMDCVRFGHEHGYTWGVNTVYTWGSSLESLSTNKQACIAYAIAHGAPPGNTFAPSTPSQPCIKCGPLTYTPSSE